MRLRPLSLVALVTLATCVAACGLEISGQGSPDDPAPGVDDAGSSLVPLSPSPVQPPSVGDDSDAAAPSASANDDAGSPDSAVATDSGAEEPTDSGSADASSTHTPPPPPPPPGPLWDGGADAGHHDAGLPWGPDGGHGPGGGPGP